MPLTFEDALKKDDFYKLPPEEQKKVLGTLNSDFAGLPDKEQAKVIGKYHLNYLNSSDFADAHPGSARAMNPQSLKGKIFEQTGAGLNTFAEDIPGFVKGTATMLGNALTMNPQNPMGHTQALVSSGMQQGDEQVEQARQARQAWKEGRKSEAFGHGTAAVLPGIGPAAAQAGEEIGHGEIGKGLAHTTELLAPFALHTKAGQKALGYAGQKIGEGVDAWNRFRKVDPEIAISKAWGFTPSQDTIGADIKEGLAYIKKANGGGPIKTNKEAIAAAGKANRTLTDHFDKWMDQGRKLGVTVDGNQVVRATWDSIPDTLKRAEPAKVKVIMARARRAFGNQQLSVDQADQIRRELTNDLKSFYDSSTGKQISALNGTKLQAVVKAQRDAIATGLYNVLDPATGGQGPREIRQMQATVVDALDAARRRTNMATSSKPVSKASAVAGALPKAVSSVTGGPGLGYVRGADIMNPETLWAGSVDPWVRKAFDAVGDPTIQLRTPPAFSPFTPNLAGQPNRLLPPPRGNTIRNPTPGPSPIVTPPPAGSYPTSGPLPRKYPVGSGVNRLLGKPTQVQRPGFAVTDAVPVKDPRTGKIIYVPQHEADAMKWQDLKSFLREATDKDFVP